MESRNSGRVHFILGSSVKLSVSSCFSVGNIRFHSHSLHTEKLKTVKRLIHLILLWQWVGMQKMIDFLSLKKNLDILGSRKSSGIS